MKYRWGGASLALHNHWREKSYFNQSNIEKAEDNGLVWPNFWATWNKYLIKAPHQYQAGTGMKFSFLSAL